MLTRAMYRVSRLLSRYSPASPPKTVASQGTADLGAQQRPTGEVTKVLLARRNRLERAPNGCEGPRRVLPLAVWPAPTNERAAASSSVLVAEVGRPFSINVPCLPRV